MTAPMHPTGAGGPAVDRRWFEDALRAQGFVVSPPEDVDHPPTPAPDLGPTAVIDTVDAALSPEASDPNEAVLPRPPVPSALLARIATRGQAVAAVAGPERAPGPEHEMEPEPATDVAPGAGSLEDLATRRAVAFDGVAPWEVAAAATVAPWSPVPVAPGPVEPAETAEPSEPERPMGSADPAEPVVEAKGDLVATSTSVADPSPEPVPAAAPPTVLDGPRSSVGSVTDAAPAPATPPSPVAPESTAGELWALVGASGPAAAHAPWSEAVRVVLTVLTALVILVIVVGSLVIASQMA